MTTTAREEYPSYGDYLLLDWDKHPQESTVESPQTAPTVRLPKATKSPSAAPVSDRSEDATTRGRQPRPSNNIHSKNSEQIIPKRPPPLPIDVELSDSNSETVAGFFDLRTIHDLSSHDDLDSVPPEILELHLKRAKEKNGVNPDELPEVWKAPPAPEVNNETVQVDNNGDDGDEQEDGQQQQEDEQQGDDSVELVQRAPDEDDFTISNDCRSVQGKYGERASKNPGIILRYQYELIQDLEGIDWTLKQNGEKDGTEYLKENIVPNVEQGIGDVLIKAMIEECGGGIRRLRGLKSTVAGLDGEPTDFPLDNEECISTYTPLNPFESYQCHVMEGAVTLYFPPTYSYPTVLTAATLQVLRAIKDGMESGELEKSSDKIISLLFLDKSYNLKPVYPGEEVSAVESTDVESASIDNERKSNVGLIVGMVIFSLIILAFIVAGFFYKRYRDEEFARLEEQRREAEELYAKSDSLPTNSNDNRVHAIFEGSASRMHSTLNDDDDGTTTSDDGDGTTTSDDGDGTTTSDDGDGTTTSDDGTTTSDDGSTTSVSKETTTDSSDSESDSDSGGYGNMYRRKKQRDKKVKNNIVYTGGDEASVMTGATGATGFHSVSSQRTAKVKNVIPVMGVDINMR